MGSSNTLNLTFKISLSFFIFSLFVYNSKVSPQSLGEIICEKVGCGQGKCVPSSSSFTGYDCECDEGWKQLKLGIYHSACVIPNCSISYQCGSGASSPPSLTLPDPTNTTDPCGAIWCNNGKCVVNGTTGHYCQCDDGNENLFDNPDFACFPQCAFGADCHSLGLGPNSPPPPPPSKSGSPGTGNSTHYFESPLPPSSSSGSPNTGSTNEANCSKTLGALTIMILSTLFLAWT